MGRVVHIGTAQQRSPARYRMHIRLVYRKQAMGCFEVQSDACVQTRHPRALQRSLRFQGRLATDDVAEHFGRPPAAPGEIGLVHPRERHVFEHDFAGNYGVGWLG